MAASERHTTGRVIVCTSPIVTKYLGEQIRSKRPAEIGLEEVVDSAGRDLPDLLPKPDSLIDLIKPLPQERLIRSLDQSELIEIEGEKGPAGWDPGDSLLGHWVLDPRGLMEVGELLLRLNTYHRREFSLAYAEPAYRDPNGFSPQPAPYLGEQRYLNPNPEGINAKAAWARGCAGEGVRLGDVEAEWNLTHPDLKPSTIDQNRQTLVYGDDYSAAALKTPGEHGTKVLGVIVAADNHYGVVGIAPKTETVFLASRYDHSPPPSMGRVSDAIVALMAHGRIGSGDVLLLEVETSSGHPVEVVPDVLTAVRLAVRTGIVVVEPAGNGNHNLDRPLRAVSGWPPPGVSGARAEKILNPSNPNAVDSEAIMVGAADFSSGDLTTLRHHGRLKGSPGGSNYGARVDCFAQGNSVFTTVNGVPGYADAFGHTSAAASIIAGAAILTQQMQKNSNGTNLSSKGMRDLLSDSSLGFKSNPWEPIGVMPDLGKIAGHLFARS